MSSNIWQRHKLGEIVDDIAMGPFGSNLKVDNFISDGVPVIRGGNLNAGGFEDENFVFVSEEKANSLKRSLAYPDDLVFTHRGTIGQVGIIPHGKYPKYLVSQSQMRLTVSRKYLEPKFLYYFFKSPIGQFELLKNSSQVGVPAIASPTTALKDVEINLPPLRAQRSIADILSSLDEKIELNHQTIATLDLIAKTIFKEWFVEFNSSGVTGTAVESELGFIPSGWTVAKLGELCTKITKGTTPTTLGDKFVEQGVAFVRAECIQDEAEIDSTKVLFITNETHEKLKRSQLAENDILITIAGSIGRIGMVTNGILPANTNQAVGIIRVDPTSIPVTYVLYYLKQQRIKDELLAGITQSVQANISLNDLNNLKILVPPRNLSDRYSTIILEIRRSIENLTAESMTLGSLRDLLLPRFINGEIEV